MGERTVVELQDLSELSHTRRVRLLMGEGRPHERDGIDVTGRMGRGEEGDAREREKSKELLNGIEDAAASLRDEGCRSMGVTSRDRSSRVVLSNI